MLHVTNGDSAVAILRGAGLDGEFLAWRDVLHDGPVPADVDDLAAVRARYIASQGWAVEGEVLADFRARDERLARAGSEVTLWFEHDLYDQLQLLQVVDALGYRAPRAEVVHSDHFIGELGREEVGPLHAARAPLGDAAAEEARRAWAAFRAPDPRGIEQEAGSAVHLPHLASALRRLLEELPWTRDGLSRTERALLTPLLDGAQDAVSLFLAAQAAEEARFMGDVQAWSRLAELAGGDVPLLRGVRETADPVAAFNRREEGELRGLAVMLTPEGERVLAGEADRIALRGIDRWVGGVHLHGHEVPWRWDGDSLAA